VLLLTIEILMNNFIRYFTLTGVLFVAVSFDIHAQDLSFAPDIESRISRMERILNNQSGSDLVLQVQRLQTEIQELRGLLEAQQLTITKLERVQRDQYLDIDSRLEATRPISSNIPNAPAAEETAGNNTVANESPPKATPALVPPAPNGIPPLPLPESQSGNERDAYGAAFSLLKERKYNEAKAAFDALLRSYPQGQFTDSARYWLGETYYVQRNYPAALDEFNRLIQNHPNSPKVVNALLRIGYIQFDQKAFTQAKASLQQVISRYPNSTEARLARSRLERISE
jgi:tol-pal system protein YbgF